MLALLGVADFALAGLLIAVSGFLFGGAPQGMDGGAGTTILFVAALAGCAAAPFLGAWLWRRSPAAGLLLAAAPLIVGALLAMGVGEATWPP